MVVVVIAVQVYNNNFSFSTVFVMIRENKKTHNYRLRGAMPPSLPSLLLLLLLLLPPLVLLGGQ